jgi:hypothetical protein
MDPTQATTALESESELPVLAIEFTQVPDYTTFLAEFALTNGDIVFHFFPTEEVKKLPQARAYWLETFPAILERVAKDYFRVDYPRLKAAYTEEQASWWLRAYGFSHLLDPEAFTQRFLLELDRGLEAAMANST